MDSDQKFVLWAFAIMATFIVALAAIMPNCGNG